MIYPKFFNEWIATCMRCNLAILHYSTINSKDKFKAVLEQEYYDLKLLKEYFIIDNEMYEVRSCCGKCFNKNCKSYMKNQ